MRFRSVLPSVETHVASPGRLLCLDASSGLPAKGTHFRIFVAVHGCCRTILRIVSVEC